MNIPIDETLKQLGHCSEGNSVSVKRLRKMYDLTD